MISILRSKYLDNFIQLNTRVNYLFKHKNNIKYETGDTAY